MVKSIVDEPREISFRELDELLANKSCPAMKPWAYHRGEPTLKEYASRHNAPYCSRCGEKAEDLPDDVGGVVCWRCAHVLSVARALGYVEQPGAKRRCPDCGAPIAPRKKYCKECAKRRRRAKERDRKRKERAGVRKQASEPAEFP